MDPSLNTITVITVQHELALVVLLEQLYRAYTIKRGEPTIDSGVCPGAGCRAISRLEPCADFE